MTTTRRALTALATGALTLPFLAAPAAYAAPPDPPPVQSIAGLCANVAASYNPFTDDEPNTFTDAIECMAFAGVTRGGPNGLPTTQYGPALTVQRDAMASFIARMIDAADQLDTGNNITTLPQYDGSNAFTDVRSDNPHLQPINRLEAAGIVQGGPGGAPPSQYGPFLRVTRAQMASFLNRAVAFMQGGDPALAGRSTGYTTTDDYFLDDEQSTHEANINGIASEGISVGRDGDTYQPERDIPRDQMAGFLARTLATLFEAGDIGAIGSRLAVTPDTAETKPAVANPAGANDGTTTDDREFTVTGLDNAKDYRITLVRSENVRRESNGTITFKGEADSNSSTGFSAVTGSPTADITKVNGTNIADSDTATAGQQSGTTVAVPADGRLTFTIDGDAGGETVVPVVYVNGGAGKSAADGGTSPRLEVRVQSAGEFGQPIESFDIGGATTFTAAAGGAAAVTSRPELVSASIGQPRTVEGTITDRQVTDVTFTFDEPVTGKAPTASQFHLVGFDSANRSDGTQAVVQTDQRVVVVTFGSPQTNTSPGSDFGAEQVRNVSIATVDVDAVRDAAGNENPIGVTAVGTTRTDQPPAAGVTAAPDLQSVSLSSDGNTTTSTPVVFTFDEPAFTVVANGFKLVTISGQVLTCTARSGQVGGQPSSTEQADETILTDCAETSETGDIALDEIARGYVDQGTVSDTRQDTSNDLPQRTNEGNLNPLQATETPDANSTGGPDLVSATFSAGDDQSDQVTYTFDEAVLIDDAGAAPTDPDGSGGQLDFRVYSTGGRETSATSVTRPSQDTTVVATFPEGTLRDAVGASVREAAVRAVSGTNRINRADEEGVANTAAPTVSESGRTDGPDLLSVAVGSDDRAVYTFDEAVAADNQLQSGNVVESSFLLYLADGTRLRCDAATVGTGTAANQVTCTTFTVVDVPTGGTSGTATAAQVQSAVLGTVDNGAVRDTESQTSPNQNPEGARNTTGTTGTPAT